MTEDRITFTTETAVVLPKAEHEEVLAMRRVEWQRVRRRVERLSNPLSGASEWSATFFGLGAGALLSLIPIVSATSDQQPWVIPLFWVVGISFLVLAGFMLWVHRKMRHSHSDDVTDICGEMDEIEAWYTHHEATSP